LQKKSLAVRNASLWLWGLSNQPFLQPSKLDEIKIKANILASFLEEKVISAKEGAEEALEDVKETAEKLRQEL